MAAGLTSDQFNAVLANFGLRAFSTFDFSQQVEVQYPVEWSEIINKYGDGGKGAGRYYSAYTRVAQILDSWTKQKVLDKLDFRPAPQDWGSPIIRYWALDRDRLDGTRYPDEIPDDPSFPEGAKTIVTVNRYERNPQARQKCIEHYGIRCCACDFDFEARYGPHGAGFIHVHHLKPLSTIGEAYEVDPVRDLRPVCPNCHAMIHLGQRSLSIEELKQFLSDAGPGFDSSPDDPSVQGKWR
jgi:hypothetical protein